MHKIVTLPGGETRRKSEHDEIMAIASEQKTSYLELKQKIDREIEEHLSSK